MSTYLFVITEALKKSVFELIRFIFHLLIINIIYIR